MPLVEADFDYEFHFTYCQIKYKVGVIPRELKPRSVH